MPLRVGNCVTLGTCSFISYLFNNRGVVKFMYSKKATKIDEIFIGDMKQFLCSKRQINGEDHEGIQLKFLHQVSLLGIFKN
jgi:hypothetical protein